DGTVAHGDIDDRSAEGSGKTNLTLSKLATWVGEFLGVAGDTKVEEGANYTSRGNATIDGDVTGSAGSSINFEKNAVIKGDVKGTGTKFTFSTNPDNTSIIDGKLDLKGGSE